jgi:dimethylglycine dehydrogenase
VTLAIESTDADAAGYEPVYVGTDLVGFVTSGGYGHTVSSSLAMAYVDSGTPDEGLTVTIVGEPRAARILSIPAYDPSGDRMRS